jgi:hypothetical protein
MDSNCHIFQWVRWFHALSVMRRVGRGPVELDSKCFRFALCIRNANRLKPVLLMNWFDSAGVVVNNT